MAVYTALMLRIAEHYKVKEHSIFAEACNA